MDPKSEKYHHRISLKFLEKALEGTDKLTNDEKKAFLFWIRLSASDNGTVKLGEVMNNIQYLISSKASAEFIVGYRYLKDCVNKQWNKE